MHVFLVLPDPSKVRLENKGDLSFFNKQDDVSFSKNMSHKYLSLILKKDAISKIEIIIDSFLAY